MVRMKSKIHISIIIVNFNGRHLLFECLHALESLDYPRSEFEVILVENNSSDDSVPYIKRYFPWVVLVELEENTGFTGGNNIGISKAQGEYIVFLNTDVRVEQGWLRALVHSASQKNIGIVSSKLRYAVPFINVEISSRAVPRSQLTMSIDHSPVGVLVEDVICEDQSLTKQVFYKDGFYEKKDGEVTIRRTQGVAHVLVPFPLEKTSHEYVFTIHGYESSDKHPIDVKLRFGNETHEITVLPYHTHEIKITMRLNKVKDHLIWLVQNAGNIVSASGYSKDRGSLVVLQDHEVREFYEPESSYFEQGKQLLSACGAACLIKRDVLDHVGTFDGHYFMYYEDVELSLRAWRAGWNVVFEPKAIGYHRHRATTGTDESAFLIEHVERNRMAMVITHFPWKTVGSEFILFSIRCAVTTLKSFVFQFRDNFERSSLWHRRYEGRRAAYFFILQSLPRLVSSRLKMQKYWPYSYQKLKKFLY